MGLDLEYRNFGNTRLDNVGTTVSGFMSNRKAQPVEYASPNSFSELPSSSKPVRLVRSYISHREFQRVQKQPAAQSEVLERLTEIENWNDNWDGYGSKSLRLPSIKYATVFVKLLPQVFESLSPKVYISADGQGRVMMEWWQEDRALVLYFDESEIVFVKSSGDISELYMEDGIMSDASDFEPLWDWLRVGNMTDRLVWFNTSIRGYFHQ